MNRLLLAGPSGVGKSTVGRVLAGRAGLDFVDLDDVVVSAAGMDVVGIFAAEGEDGFRRRERLALDGLEDRDRVVVALGGGTVGAGLGALAGWPRAVLMAETATLLQRLGDADGRPMLAVDRASRVQTLRQRRMPGWTSFGLFVHTDGLGALDVARRVEWAW